MTGNASRTSQRCLWKPRAEAGDHEPLSAAAPTYDEILHQCHTRPHQKSLYQLCSNSLVIVQEICLTVYILVQAERIEQQHRQKQRTDLSNGIMFAALLLVLFYSSRAERSQQARRVKLKQRSIDGLLLAVLLRYIASLLQSLTASYSTDTVQNLAYSGMILHLLACDYSYANGRLAHSEEELSSSSRPHFLGGTMSLNAALFSTTLLVSRLSPMSAYFIMSLSVVIFAFYPVTRNAITASYPASKSRKFDVWLLRLRDRSPLRMHASSRNSHSYPQLPCGSLQVLSLLRQRSRSIRKRNSCPFLQCWSLSGS